MSWNPSMMPIQLLNPQERHAHCIPERLLANDMDTAHVPTFRRCIICIRQDGEYPFNRQFECKIRTSYIHLQVMISPYHPKKR